MAIVFHFVSLEILTTRIVHDHNKSAIEWTTHHFLIETQRGILLGLGNGLAVLILESIGKLLNRLAKGHLEHTINLGEHLGLLFLDSC